MSGDPARAQLDVAVLDWMREPAWRTEETDGARFEALALDAFAFQFEHCAPYRGFCERRGRTPSSVRSWSDVPTVPTGAFKELALTSFPLADAVHVFRTSGTSIATRGALHLDTLALYEASLLPTFRRLLLPDLGPDARIRLEVLAASPDEAPDSSLSHMFGVALRALGSRRSAFAVQGGTLDVDATLARLERDIADEEPVLLCGTAFGFAHLLEALARRGVGLALPAASRAMETGGFKGRARVLPRTELYAGIEARLGIPARRVVNQYGMTELGSQFYDSVLSDPGGERRKLGPPWARVRILDPETGAAAAEGAVGVIAVFDLANTGSVCAIQTADLGRRLADGFEIQGRAEGAEARGCSIAADEMLAGSTP